MTSRSPLDREIWRLALPTFATLLAEPLFLIVDTALIGHLGQVPLAGLGIASVVLQTVVGLAVFLAYATTPAVARLVGAGDRRGALRAGVDGIWLAVAVGAVLLVLGLLASGRIADAFGSTREVTDAATTYLVISVWGLPAMLIVLATTGLLRGLQDTRTPLVVVGIGFGANALLNAAFIYGLGWGIAGSAFGTVLAQWGMAVIFLWRIVVLAQREGARVSPRWVGVATVAASGGWLLLRTVSLRISLLATVVVGSALSVAELGALQIGLALFSLLAFGLDALAIAGQAMIGAAFGAVDRARVVAITRRLILFGVAGGVGLGVVVAALSPVLGLVFTSDTDVTDAVVPVVLLLALGTPLAGFVFVLDGVLIGANDSRYLAVSGILNLAMYLPLLWLAAQSQSLVAVWAAFGLGYIGARALTLGLRVRGERWVERSIDRSTAARSTIEKTGAA